MRKISLFVIISLIALPCSLYAKKRSMAEMKAAALSALNDNSLSSKGAITKAANLDVAFETSQMTVLSSAYNTVIVSNDDAFDAVLAITETPFTTADLDNPGLKWWVEAMNESLETYLATGTRPKKVAPSANHKPAVPALLTTKWGQDAPYNNKTPTYIQNNVEKHFVTGCVATGMAQIMKYYNYPATGQGSTSYRCNLYIDGDVTTKLITLNFAKANFAWDDMLDTYGASATDAQKDAVANLMYNCGVSVKMDYDISGSGSFTFKAADALVSKFLYDSNLCMYVRSFMNETEWMNIIFTHLSDGEPILYGGQSKSGGHEFVIDGYNEKGLVSVNWGWNGKSDGFFDISSLNGYSSSQDMLPVFMPKENSIRRSMFGYGDAAGLAVSKTLGGKLNASASYCINLDYRDFNGSVAMMAKSLDNPEAEEMILSQKSASCMAYGYDLKINSFSVKFENVSVASLPDGKYRVYLATKCAEQPAWQPIRSKEDVSNSSIITVTAGKPTIETDSDSSWTGIENVSADTQSSHNDVDYNLNGMRVNGAYKGIVIRNGKKYIRK
ncbi:MAG: C10 family peptidase [Prevotella sp.]